MQQTFLPRLLYLPLGASLLSAPALAREGAGLGAEEVAEKGLEAAKNGFELFLEDPAGTLKDWAVTDGVAIGGKVLLFLVLCLLARLVAKLVSGLVRKTLSAPRLKLSDLLKNFAVNTTRNTILFLGVLFAMASVGIPIGPFLAAFGVVGFVVGFALQNTMSNFASGVMILIYRPYDVGDVVTAGGETGTVRAMNLVSTTLLAPDNQVKIVPNGSIWGGVITNRTTNDTRRVNLTFGIDYADDIELAERVLLEIVSAHDLILDDPEPFIKLSELADNSVNFVVRVWASTDDYSTVKYDITREVKLRFDKEGLSFPFPQQEVHMHQAQ